MVSRGLGTRSLAAPEVCTHIINFVDTSTIIATVQQGTSWDPSAKSPSRFRLQIALRVLATKTQASALGARTPAIANRNTFPPVSH